MQIQSWKQLNELQPKRIIIDDQLTFTAHIASVSRSCRFALYNIRKMRPYLTQCDTQLLWQTLVNSRLDYCNALLTGLPACVVKQLQMIQNAAVRLVFNQPKRTHVPPLLIELHWLPVAARMLEQGDFWFCSHLLKCSCKGKCYTQDAALVKYGNPNYIHL